MSKRPITIEEAIAEESREDVLGYKDELIDAYNAERRLRPTAQTLTVIIWYSMKDQNEVRQAINLFNNELVDCEVTETSYFLTRVLIRISRIAL